MDSLLSIVQMPAGVPVGTLAIGKSGAINAALLAAAVLALSDAGAGRAARRLAREADRRRRRGACGRGGRSAQMNPGPSHPPIAPGATIGILGGGQLGRMLAMAAARLGLNTHIYAPDPGPAFDVAARARSRPTRTRRRSPPSPTSVDVVTYEFENVPAHTAAVLEDASPGAAPPAGARLDAGPARREAVPERHRHRHRALSCRWTTRPGSRGAVAQLGLPVDPEDAAARL